MIFPFLLGAVGVAAATGIGLHGSASAIRAAEASIIPILNIRQVCKMLNLSEPTIRRYIKSGELSPTITSNKKGYEFARDDVIAFARKKNIMLNTEGLMENDVREYAVPAESKASVMLKKAEEGMNADNKPSHEQMELILSALTNEKETLELMLESLTVDDAGKEAKNDILQLKLAIKSKVDEILYCKYMMTQI